MSGLSGNPEDAFRLGAACADLEARSLLRDRLVLEGAQGPEIRVGGESLLNFSSNDYLGYAADPRVIAALKTGADRHGVGAGASAVVSGWSRAHAELEERVAAFTARESALLFGSGYLANLALGLSGLVGPGDHMIEDRLNHASLIDAARVSGARLRRYPHLDCGRAREMMQDCSNKKLVLTDGVFSMDGDLAPVTALAQACRSEGALLAVDDAHGLGVLGANGGGVLDAAGVDAGAVPLLVGTFGKAFGTAGAFIAGSRDMIRYLGQCARTHLFTTAPPASLAFATTCAMTLATGEPGRREHLLGLVRRFRTGAARQGLPISTSTTPIQPVPLGTPARALAVGQMLRQAGILVAVVRPPTVPAGTSRLRVTLTAAHRHEHVDRLLEKLAEILHGCEQ